MVFNQMKDELSCTTTVLGGQCVVTVGNGISEMPMQYAGCLDIPLLLEPGDQDSLEKEMVHPFIGLTVVVQK